MKYPWAVPGAEVVCVDAEPRHVPGCGGYWEPLEQGAIYIVSDIRADERPACKGELAVFLKGRPNPDLRGVDYGYNPDRFRPVLPDTTDTVAALKRGIDDALSGSRRNRVKEGV